MPPCTRTKEMSLVLSSDAKPRLKWTSDLHQQFIHAVDQLGGSHKATPKSLMRVMGVPGLTLYHLKSHIQKYRMGRTQQSQSRHQNKQLEKQRSHFTSKARDGAKEQINILQMTQALKMQMEVQRKLHEQIEVQRHLQLRMEAQGQYLQSVLKKAEQTMSEYGSCSIEAANVKAQLCELVSMVDSGSSLTLENGRNKVLGHHGHGWCSSESSWRKDETQDDRNFIGLSLVETDKNGSERQGNNIEKSLSGRFPLDLNCKSDPAPKIIDLNSKGEDNV